jgi:biotin operon repressor
MKEVWRCCWEVIPGGGEQTEQFPTLAAAKQAMRQIIAESIDLKEYTADLDPQAAHFLDNYLSDPQFPRDEADVPEEYEEPERGELTLDAGFIIWDYPYDAYPKLDTNLVLTDWNDGEYRFMFYYVYPKEATGNGATELSITIAPHIDYGTSAYPLMVLFALCEDPQTQGQIIRTISKSWDTIIDRKAIGRHLQLLQDLGFPVQHGPDGYYYNGEPGTPKSDVKFTPSAYPLLILGVLDGTPKTQTEIIREVQAKYGAKIGRKAVKGHLELLEELGYSVEQDPNGYHLR